MENQTHRSESNLPRRPAQRSEATGKVEPPAGEPRTAAHANSAAPVPPPPAESPTGGAGEGQARPSQGVPLSGGTPGPQNKPKTVLGGDFQLLRKVGAGAMGVVYKARQISLNRDVALKVLFKHVAANRTLLKRFVREARIMAQLNHPNIVRCYGVGKEQGRPYLIMEYVDGRSLREWLMQRGPFGVGDALHLILACARALQHAHERGLVHRDVKPDNILLTRAGVVKVADLGLAKAVQEDLSVTQSGHGAGTPVYMAPEQARNAKYVDHRSDIYALGCMLYQLLTGQLPFRGTTILEVILAKIEGKFRPARQLNPAIPKAVDALLAKMLARLPEERYQSCAEVIRTLKNLGLDHAALSFLAASSGAAPGPVPLAPTIVDWRAGKSAGAAAPNPLTETASDWWYVVYRTREGKWLSRKLTTEQIRSALQDEHFYRTARVSSTAQGDYRSLANYPEFAAALRARQRQTKTQRKAAQLVARCEQIRVEERRRQRWDAWRRLWRTRTGLLVLGAVGILIVSALLLLYLLPKGS